MANVIDLNNKQLVIVDNDKKITCIEYEDGTCDMFLDLDNKTIAAIHKLADEEGCTSNEAAVKMIKEQLASFEKEE